MPAESRKMNVNNLSTPAIFTALIALFLLDAASATDESSLKPHSLYMRRLRELLSDYHVSVPNSWDRNDSFQGKLVATSIETHDSSGRGYSENGFAFEETNEIELEFPIPKVSTSGEGPDVELWILPDKSLVPRNRVVEITFRAVAEFPHAYNERTHVSSLVWNTNEDCVYLNLTSLSRKISKVLHKKNVNETNMTLAVSIIRVEELELDFQMDNSSIDPLHHHLCTAMLPRETNDSFLVIKNYNEKYMQEEFARHPFPTSFRKRSVHQILTNLSTVANRPQSGCAVVPLVVNLTEVYGDFIKAPIVTDVRDCSGRCTLLHDGGKFSKHGEIKERLKFLPGGEFFSGYEPSCTPIKFGPLHVLIGLQPKSEVIVQLSDLLVDRCVCQ